MTAYFVGDIPAADLLIDAARGGLALVLTPFNAASVTVRDPAGTAVTPAPGATIASVDTVSIQWPATSIFTMPGVYVLSIVLTAASGKTERLAPVRVVVQAVADGWYTLDELRTDWEDAPDDDLLCHDLLEVARRAVVAYAPFEDAGPLGYPPYHWRKAQLMHARTLWNADKGDAADSSVGLGGFTVTPKSLEKSTREVLRPRMPLASV